MLTTWGAGATAASALVRGDVASRSALVFPIGRARIFLGSPQKSWKIRVILIRHGQTEFNRIFSITRRDPGIRDPHLTVQGCRQVQAVARVSFNLARLITSPDARALETTAIIAEHLSVPITVDPLIAERFSFICESAHPWPSFGPGDRI